MEYYQIRIFQIKPSVAFIAVGLGLMPTVKINGVNVMNTYVYVSDESVLESMKEYAVAHYDNAQIITETLPLMGNWRERELNRVLDQAGKGDAIAVLDGVSLARSHAEVLGFLEAALEKGVRVEFIKYGLVFKAEADCNFMDMLDLVRHIESDFVSQRNCELFEKRKELGITLGRPVGHKNASLKLDKYKKDIDKYLKLAISKASIAKLVGCHPQTLYNWIERNEKVDQKTSKCVKRKKSEVV